MKPGPRPGTKFICEVPPGYERATLFGYKDKIYMVSRFQPAILLNKNSSHFEVLSAEATKILKIEIARAGT